MTDESAHNNPQDPKEERFTRMEEKVDDISRNMVLLMANIARKLGLFREVGGSKHSYQLNENRDLKTRTLAQKTHIFAHKTSKSIPKSKSGATDSTIF